MGANSAGSFHSPRAYSSLLLTPLARVMATRFGSIDRPVGLKIHKRATPLMGGVAVFLAFALAR